MVSVKKRFDLRERSIIRSFSLQLVQKIGAWIALGIGLIFLKGHISRDIFGELYQKITKSQNPHLQEFFLGTGPADRQKLLNYALIFLGVIIFLNIVVVFSNIAFKLRDKYIENNKFYLHNKWVFIINTLIHIAYACLLTASFVSIFTLILSLSVITFNSWELFPWQKNAKNPQLECYFSWKDQYVRKIILYSTIIIFVVPIIIGRLQAFHNNALAGSPEGFAKAYNTLVTSNLAVKNVMELVMQGNYNLFHWFVLLWFVKNIISDRQGEYANFWAEINGIEKRVANFKHYYYYQESLSIANNTLIDLGDYNYLENSPSFMIKDYLEGDLDIKDFAEKNCKVIKVVEFFDDQIKHPSKRNFLDWCLFNDFGSWEDCLRTKRLVSERIGRFA